MSDERDPGIDPGPRDVDDLLPSEAARARRRDRDATAAQRDLLRPGMGKVFKQILDVQARDATRPARTKRRRRRRRGGTGPH